jgi:hypothetical protein
MKSSRYFDRFALVALLAGLAIACADKLASTVAAGEPNTIPESAQPSSGMPQSKEAPNSNGRVAPQASGLVVHIDPVTGEILPKPQVAPDQKPDPQVFQSAPAPASQFVEVASPSPGGGVKVHLNRQFHQPLVATVDSDGKIRLRHRPAQNAGGEVK